LYKIYARHNKNVQIHVHIHTHTNTHQPTVFHVIHFIYSEDDDVELLTLLAYKVVCVCECLECTRIVKILITNARALAGKRGGGSLGRIVLALGCVETVAGSRTAEGRDRRYAAARQG